MKKNNKMEYTLYGKPGTDEVMVAHSYIKFPDDWVEVKVHEKPDNDKPYVLDHQGNWVVSKDYDYKKERKARYLETYPVHKQLEVLFDALNGDETGLEAMKKAFNKIKENIPKN